MGQQTTGKSETMPWVETQPYYKDIYSRGAALAERPTQYFPDSTVAARSPQEVLASEQMTNRATAGSALARAGTENLRATAAGEFLNPETNPYLAQTFRDASSEVTRAYQTAVIPGLTSRFAGAGGAGMVRDPNTGELRFASGALRNAGTRAQDVLAQNLNELGTQIFGGNYQQERSRQLAAAGAAGEVAMQDYGDIEALAAAGRGDRGYAQAVLEDAIARFEFGQEEPWARVERFRNLISQPTFSTTKSRNTMTDDYELIGSILGGAGSLGGIAALFACSKELKDIFGDLDVDDTLERALTIPLYRWTYKGWSTDGEAHIGPMAEDWQKATGLGDGREIAVIDAFGLLMACVQALARRLEALEKPSTQEAA